MLFCHRWTKARVVPAVAGEAIVPGFPAIDSIPGVDTVPVIDGDPAADRVHLLDRVPVIDRDPVIGRGPVIDRIPVLVGDPVVAAGMLDCGEIVHIPNLVTVVFPANTVCRVLFHQTFGSILLEKMKHQCTLKLS